MFGLFKKGDDSKKRSKRSDTGVSRQSLSSTVRSSGPSPSTSLHHRAESPPPSPPPPPSDPSASDDVLDGAPHPDTPLGFSRASAVDTYAQWSMSEDIFRQKYQQIAIPQQAWLKPLESRKEDTVQGVWDPFACSFYSTLVGYIVSSSEKSAAHTESLLGEYTSVGPKKGDSRRSFMPQFGRFPEWHPMSIRPCSSINGTAVGFKNNNGSFDRHRKSRPRLLFQYKPYSEQVPLTLSIDDISAVVEAALGVPLEGKASVFMTESSGVDMNKYTNKYGNSRGVSFQGKETHEKSIDGIASVILIKLVIDMYLTHGPKDSFVLALSLLQPAMLKKPSERVFHFLYNLSLHGEMLYREEGGSPQDGPLESYRERFEKTVVASSSETHPLHLNLSPAGEPLDERVESATSVSSFQKWVRELLFRMLSLLVVTPGLNSIAISRNDEALWSSAISCLIHMTTVQGRTVKSFFSTDTALPSSSSSMVGVLAAFLDASVVFHWSPQLQSWLLMVATNLMVPEQNPKETTQEVTRTPRKNPTEETRSENPVKPVKKNLLSLHRTIEEFGGLRALISWFLEAPTAQARRNVFAVLFELAIASLKFSEDDGRESNKTSSANGSDDEVFALGTACLELNVEALCQSLVLARRSEEAFPLLVRPLWERVAQVHAACKGFACPSKTFISDVFGQLSCIVTASHVKDLVPHRFPPSPSISSSQKGVVEEVDLSCLETCLQDESKAGQALAQHLLCDFLCSRISAAPDCAPLLPSPGGRDDLVTFPVGPMLTQAMKTSPTAPLTFLKAVRGAVASMYYNSVWDTCMRLQKEHADDIKSLKDAPPPPPTTTMKKERHPKEKETFFQAKKRCLQMLGAALEWVVMAPKPHRDAALVLATDMVFSCLSSPEPSPGHKNVSPSPLSYGGGPGTASPCLPGGKEALPTEPRQETRRTSLGTFTVGSSNECMRDTMSWNGEVDVASPSLPSRSSFGQQYLIAEEEQCQLERTSYPGALGSAVGMCQPAQGSRPRGVLLPLSSGGRSSLRIDIPPSIQYEYAVQGGRESSQTRHTPFSVGRRSSIGAVGGSPQSTPQFLSPSSLLVSPGFPGERTSFVPLSSPGIAEPAGVLLPRRVGVPDPERGEDQKHTDTTQKEKLKKCLEDALCMVDQFLRSELTVCPKLVDEFPAGLLHTLVEELTPTHMSPYLASMQSQKRVWDARAAAVLLLMARCVDEKNDVTKKDGQFFSGLLQERDSRLRQYFALWVLRGLLQKHPLKYEAALRWVANRAQQAGDEKLVCSPFLQVEAMLEHKLIDIVADVA